MASSFVDCPANAWTLVAENVTTGVIHKVSAAPSMYLQAYVPNGDTAPTTRLEGVQAFKESNSVSVDDIVSTSAIDVYLWADNGIGRVRADL